VSTITANFTNPTGIIRSDFYGTNVHSSWLRNNNYISPNGNGVYDTPSNVTWNRQMFLSSGMTYAREDANIDSCYIVTNVSNVYSFTRTCDFTDTINEYAWAKANGVRILNLLSYMPSGLANKSSQCSNTAYCPPMNYDVWGKIVVDYINATTNNGQYLSTVDYEVWNEPDLYEFLLDNLTVHGSQAAADVYVSLYNSSYTNIKAVYPLASVGGFASAHIDRYTNLTFGFLGNFSNRMDFLSFHYYYPSWGDVNPLTTTTNNVLGYCNTFHANCSRILVDEFNYHNGSGTGGGMELSNVNLSEFYANIFANGLNLYPQNLSLMLYQWSEGTKYSDTAHYNEYPSRWSMVSEPLLDNQIYVSYNVTSAFAHLCPSGATVYQSSADNSQIQTVSCKSGNAYSVILINNGGISLNLSLNLSNYPYSNISDYNTKQVYTLSNGIATIPISDIYGVSYLTSGDLTLPNASLISPPNNTITNNPIQNLTANISDDVGIQNATIYVTNGTNIISQFFDYTGQTITNAMIGLYTTFLDGIHYFWAIVFDTSGNQVTSQNYTLTVDAINPQINYSSETELNNSNLSRSNIVVNVTSTDLHLANITIYLYNSTYSLIKNITNLTSPNYYNFTNLSDGIYWFNASSFDTLSNANYTDTRKVTIMSDTVAPIITINSPLISQSFTSGINVPLIISINDSSAITSEWYQVVGTNGNAIFYNSGTVIFTNSTLVNLANGNYNVNFCANDSAGNVGCSNVNFVVNTPVGSSNGGGGSSNNVVNNSFLSYITVNTSSPFYVGISNDINVKVFNTNNSLIDISNLSLTSNSSIPYDVSSLVRTSLGNYRFKVNVPKANDNDTISFTVKAVDSGITTSQIFTVSLMNPSLSDSIQVTVKNGFSDVVQFIKDNEIMLIVLLVLFLIFLVIMTLARRK
jgi:hypothetical protein